MFRKQIRLLTYVMAIYLSVCGPVYAQIRITYPISRMVVQRSNANQASVQVAGSFAQALDAVEVRFKPRVTGQGTDTGWLPLATPAIGQFSSQVTVMGGWYSIQVRGLQGGSVVATDSVDRFGVGEVFAIIGHSNTQGSSCFVAADNYTVDRCPTIAGSADDRVSILTVDQTTPEFNSYLSTANSDLLPGLSFPATFSKLPTFPGAAPFGNFAWLWSRFGDQLVSRIGVPVCLFNAGFGGSNMQQTYWAAYDIPFSHGFINYSIRMPYANIRTMMKMYIPATGIRAVLVQHGINDRSNPTDSTYKYYRKVIDKIRAESALPDLAMIIARDSYAGAVFNNVRTAQNQVLALSNYQVYAGPDLDLINSSTDKPDGIHYAPSGQQKAGDAWASAITDAYLSSSTPYAAEPMPLIGLACAGTNQLSLTRPGSGSALWSTGATNNTITSVDATVGLRTKSVGGKVLFPPSVVIPTTVTPPVPTVSSSTGSLSLCGSALTLLSSTQNSLWSTGSTTSTLPVSTTGTYQLQARQPAYGCLSAATAVTIGQTPARIRMNYVTNRRIVATGDTIGVSLIVENSSGCPSGTLNWLAPLPPNVNVEISHSPVVVSGNLVTGSIEPIAAYGKTSIPMTLRIQLPGTYQLGSEITSASIPLEMGTPGNGYRNGESDEAITDLRTAEASNSVYTSPNPNQVPLPAVQSSQPAPDPTKADLSLSMAVNSRVVNIGQSISFTLTITNQGGLPATGVQVAAYLPYGLQFTSSSSSMTANGSTISGTISTIAAGASQQLVFTSQVVSSSPTYLMTAQLTAASPADPDSIVNNGVDNGEDDTARIDLRTL